MADDETTPEEPDEHAMIVPISGRLSDILSNQHEAHDRRHMEIEAMVKSIYALIDNMPKDDLMVLRRLLQFNRKFLINLDGQLVSLLRVKHGVDPETGLTAAEELAEREPTGPHPKNI